jgi:hypothetical protein
MNRIFGIELFPIINGNGYSLLKGFQAIPYTELPNVNLFPFIIN